MNKLGLIFNREYLVRVKKRSFILTTLLTPLAFGLFFVIVGVIFSYESGEEKRIAIIDESGILEGTTIPSKSDGTIHFVKQNRPLEEMKEAVAQKEFDGILVIPELKNLKAKDFTVYYYAEKQLSLEYSISLQERLSSLIRDHKVDAFGLDKAALENLRTSVSIDPQPLREEDEDVSSLASVVGAVIGGIMGAVMYFAVFIYGVMIMRSVMEEKTSRIVEVMISSVRPFQLMMGKILGVGAVGLTQLAIWAVLIPLIYLIMIPIFGLNASSMEASAAASEVNPEDIEALTALVMAELSNINWWMIVPLFLIYFLGGFFLYSSLFAAVGSAVGDDMGESQSLQLPISIPVILAFYIMIVALRAPESNLAIWSSIFPLFSPIVMPARLAFDPPWWQVGLSIVLLAATAVFFVYISARIYRVGILLYGKKVTLKELGKWMFYKN